METYNTLYNWCLLNNIRPINKLSQDVSFQSEKEGDDFMLKEISLTEFKKFLKDETNYKKNSTPRKPEKFLELRMYGLVPYNISEIQKGIQFNHANDDYAIKWEGDTDYKRFKEEWKTNIILNGGTSNEGHLVQQGFTEVLYKGTMQQHLDDLTYNKVRVGTFYEPDLNSMLSAIVFLVDERVFNKELYPDFVSPKLEGDEPKDLVKWGKDNETQYNNWVDKIGGLKNAFLRDFLSNKKLA
jgi:hypothetical protein